jgi:hypothetical protein
MLWSTTPLSTALSHIYGRNHISFKNLKKQSTCITFAYRKPGKVLELTVNKNRKQFEGSVDRPPNFLLVTVNIKLELLIFMIDIVLGRCTL